MLVCVLNPRGLVGYLKFELSYAKNSEKCKKKQARGLKQIMTEAVSEK